MTETLHLYPRLVSDYRAAMADFLKSSLPLMVPSAGTETSHPGFDDDTIAECERDPFHVFRVEAAVLMRKARLHVIAVLVANREANLHSVAVQMRPALECAGQVVSVFYNLFFGKDANAMSQYINADYIQTMQRLSRGQVDRRYLLETIAKADPQGSQRKPKRLLQSDKVRSLEGGPGMYKYLSLFHHPTLDTLRGPSCTGGVTSNNTLPDQLAFAMLLDYLAHQMLVMIAHAALSPTTKWDTDPFIAKVFGRLAEKRAATRHHQALLPAIFSNAEPAPQD